MKKPPRFFCDNCGYEVGNNEKACPHCGRLFISVRCPACGYSGEDKIFKNGCPVCGYSASGGGVTNGVKSKKDKKKKSKKPPDELPFWAYIVLSAIFLILVALLSYFVTR